MKIYSLILATILFSNGVSFAQNQNELSPGSGTLGGVESPWKLMDVATDASLRGLHVLSTQIIWASGTGGTIVNSKDGGETWQVSIVEGAEKLDFRDIHAIDEHTIVAITSGTPARIYRSVDGGSQWNLCYENKDERVFLDALSFLNKQKGIVMGDPMGDKLFLLSTQDLGKTWSTVKSAPRVIKGEAGFAASGTNMTVNDGKFFIGLGSHLEGETSPNSRILVSDNSAKNWKAINVPIPRAQSAGIFSICFVDRKHGVVVGGDYQKPDNTTNNIAVTNDGGQTWSAPTTNQPPTGFRSCSAAWINGAQINVISVGPNGTDRSTDMGHRWHRISNEGFHSIDFSPDGISGWASGSEGRIARWKGVHPPADQN